MPPIPLWEVSTGSAKRTDVRSPIRRYAELTQSFLSVCQSSQEKGMLPPATQVRFTLSLCLPYLWINVFCSGSWTKCNRCLHALEPPWAQVKSTMLIKKQIKTNRTGRKHHQQWNKSHPFVCQLPYFLFKIRLSIFLAKLFRSCRNNLLGPCKQTENIQFGN